MTWWRDVQFFQEPFDVGDTDESGRVQVSFNILVTKAPDGNLLKEIVRVLVAAGVGTYQQSGSGGNIFVSSKASVPSGAGPFLSIRSTGGTSPLGTHNAGPVSQVRPSVQFIARASTWDAAEAMAFAARNAFKDIRNQHISA
jgi:hypothetical protein